MTREEAKKLLVKKALLMTEQGSDILILDTEATFECINKIYDNFENRNCKNCKWSGKWSFFESESRIFYCEKDIQFGDTGYVVEDFVCNKWEAKDEKARG